MSKNVFADNSTVFVKNGTTEFRVIGSTGDVYAGAVHVGNSSAIKAIAADGTVYAKAGVVPLGYNETLSWSSGGVTPSTATAYGLTYISMTGTDPSTSPYTVSLAAPIAGVEKTIVLDSTAAWINTIDVDLGAGVGVDGSTTNRFISFSTLAAKPQSVTLVGVSTALWEVKNVNSTSVWGVASGIRSGTAARTS